MANIACPSFAEHKNLLVQCLTSRNHSPKLWWNSIIFESLGSENILLNKLNRLWNSSAAMC